MVHHHGRWTLVGVALCWREDGLDISDDIVLVVAGSIMMLM
jgi:hypothetical protein